MGCVFVDGFVYIFFVHFVVCFVFVGMCETNPFNVIHLFFEGPIDPQKDMKIGSQRAAPLPCLGVFPFSLQSTVEAPRMADMGGSYET